MGCPPQLHGLSIFSSLADRKHAHFPCCSALFPIPLAFESTGIIAALVAMIIVAAATIYTVELLMSQATATGMHDYETLSLAVGGWWYKVRAVTLCWSCRDSYIVCMHQCTLMLSSPMVKVQWLPGAYCEHTSWVPACTPTTTETKQLAVLLNNTCPYERDRWSILKWQ